MITSGAVGAHGAATVAALVITAALVEPARRLALRHGYTDRPAVHKAHRTLTPYLGGLAVAAGTMIPTAVAVTRVTAGRVDLRLVMVLCGAAVVAVLGLLDDVRTLKPRTRIAVEATLAAVLAAAGARLGLTGPAWLDGCLTVLWVVLVTNSFNLLDNSDGALATVTCATAFPLAAAAFLTGHTGHALLLTCLAAACAGFLVHNGPPARIFLGDAGSLFIGFLIATSAVTIHSGHGTVGGLSILLLVTFVAAVDTVLVVISRKRHGRSVFQGGTDHVAHRLARLGLGQNSVLTAFLCVTATANLLALVVSLGLLPAAGTLIGTAAAATLLVVLLLLVPAYPPAGPRAAARPRGRSLVHARTASRG